jgi:CheY-like chemotaxis protein
MAIASLCTDLFFGSKIAEVAKTLGVAHVGAREVATLLERARATPPSLVIVDMSARGVDAAEAIRMLRADPATQAARIVAFLPHERDDWMAAARAAGASDVLTRGQLSKQLPKLVAGA